VPEREDNLSSESDDNDQLFDEDLERQKSNLVSESKGGDFISIENETPQL
jgi:hypothetical protein